MIGLYDLAWYPKPFGPGDMHSAGETKVLGRPEVDLVDLLVRETAQNSWDARLPGAIPIFEMRLRRLDEHVRDVLARNVFGDRVKGSALDDALNTKALVALEILDRGTKGLGGPTRNGTPRIVGEPNDYADFVLTVGAPPDDPSGGGSYGFGKTASYMASDCATIVVWSRSRNGDGTVAERFIASSMGNTFEHARQRYTGRQWWGARSREGEGGGALGFDPVTGREARELGEAIFERHFTEDETGTSILILQFAPPQDSAMAADDVLEGVAFEGVQVAERSSMSNLDAVGRLLAKSVVLNLWPKLDAGQEDQWRMDTAVFSEGRQIPLMKASGSSLLAALQVCLRAIHEVQSVGTRSSQIVQVQRTTRYGSTTGHLALVRVVANPSGDPLLEAAGSVALMRHQAELVVTYEPVPGNTVEALSWVGVFKPVAQLDADFAAAEPPAHDSWSHLEGLDKRVRSTVHVTLRAIRAGVRQFLTPGDDVEGTDSLSTGAVASALSGLVGGLAGVAASPKPIVGGRSGSRGSPRPVVEIRGIRPLPRESHDLASGRQRTVVTLTVSGAAGEVSVRAGALAVAVDGGIMPSADEVRLDRWVRGRAEGDSVTLAGSEEAEAVLSYPAGVAINFDFRADAV